MKIAMQKKTVDPRPHVVLDCFSGLRQPTWTLKDSYYEKFLSLLKKCDGHAPAPAFKAAEWGYKGFLIKKPGKPTIRIVADHNIRQSCVHDGAQQAIVDPKRNLEQWLLENGPATVKKLTIDDLTRQRTQRPIKGAATAGNLRGFECKHGVMFPTNHAAWQSTSSNCYNYANDVMAQGAVPAVPGDNSTVSWTVEKMIRAATESDRLELIAPAGTLPEMCPIDPKAHIIGIFLREPMGNGSFTDFHCLRMDADGSWSHKDGSGPVRKTDDFGQPIQDLKTAHFALELTPVGFFVSTKGVRRIN